jgi:sec-independent protein translocase protein TatB
VFSNLGFGEIAVLVVVGLVILGPERLPGALSWAMNALRQVRDYATGAQQQLRAEMGDDFEQLREPLQKLQELRGMSPTAIVTKHLFDGDDSLISDVRRQLEDTRDTFTSTARAVTSPPGRPTVPAPGIEAPQTPAAQPDHSAQPSLQKAPTMPRRQAPLQPGQRAPFDPDAT